MFGVGGSKVGCTAIEEDEMPFAGACDPLAESFVSNMAEEWQGKERRGAGTFVSSTRLTRKQ